MSPIKSLEELKKLREDAIEKRKAKTTFGNAQVIVGMGTCGIAAGARETMKAILGKIETEDLPGIVVTQTGCIGLCEREPIVQVIVGEGPKVTYGKVNSTVAKRILEEHVLHGKVVQEYVIEV
jgi:NADP-reducing hydrogenase subunit HndB